MMEGALDLGELPALHCRRHIEPGLLVHDRAPGAADHQSRTDHAGEKWPGVRARMAEETPIEGVLPDAGAPLDHGRLAQMPHPFGGRRRRGRRETEALR